MGDAGNVHRIAVTGAGAFVSYARPDQLAASIKYALSVAIDNGAFQRGSVASLLTGSNSINGLFHIIITPNCHFVIPDVVEGGLDNDALIAKLPRCFKDKAAPVWHLHESLHRLVELCREWPRVCFGSSGEYATIRTQLWHRRMSEAFETIYCKHSFSTQVHGLRMLDGRVLGNYPLATADSTNLACNVPKFEVKYPELTKAIREADYAKTFLKMNLKPSFSNAVAPF